MNSSSITPPNLRFVHTTGEGAHPGYPVVVSHTCLISFVALFGVGLQLKFPNASPYDTAHGTLMMNIFIVVTCIYFGCLVVMAILAANHNAVLEHLMNKISLLFGTLSLIIELLFLIPLFGWIVLFFWIICFIYFMCKSCQSLKTLYQTVKAQVLQDFRELKRKLVDLNRRITRIMVRIYEADNTSIINNSRATEPRTQNLNTSNGERASEHQSQYQNHTTLTEHVIYISDNKLDTPDGTNIWKSYSTNLL